MQISWAQGWRQGANCSHGLPKNHTVYNININILYYKDFLPHSCNKSTLFYFIILLACLMCSISIPNTTFSYNGSYIIIITSTIVILSNMTKIICPYTNDKSTFYFIIIILAGLICSISHSQDNVFL